MFIATNVHGIYVYDTLGPNISLVHNSIDPIISHWSKFINYLYQHIYKLIKDQFKIV